MMAEKKCKSTVGDVDRKIAHLTELVESEGQLFEEQFTSSDSAVEALQEKLVTLEEEINEEKIIRVNVSFAIFDPKLLIFNILFRTTERKN